MPTYEYRCDACGHQFELFQSMTAPVKRKCPKCSKPRLQRLICTGTDIIFKGGGFYETDYRSEGYKKAAEAEKKAAEPAVAESKSETKGEGKSDTRPETTPETKGSQTKTMTTAAKTETRTAAPKVKVAPKRAATTSKKSKRK
jgi:putative FmdB family regulatory protein